ncbi:MAG: hypothetical protein ACW99U_19310 [Candidatus Thorarchaeota archaeon]|jgi:hypothetical protein
MADAVTLRYIYPPNWEGHIAGDGALLGRDGHQGMGQRRYILHLTNISDGTGETNVPKWVPGEHPCSDGKMALRSVVEWIEYDIFGMDVTLYWDRMPGPITMTRFPGGATTTSGKIRGPLHDPGTGDGLDGDGRILLSTTNAASGDSYDLRICIRPKSNVRPGRNPGEQGQTLHVPTKDGVPQYVTGVRSDGTNH